MDGEHGYDEGHHDGHDERHVLFAWTPHGYRLQELDGPAPELGSEFEESGHRLRVVKLGASPFPGDGRRCAYAVEA